MPKIKGVYGVKLWDILWDIIGNILNIRIYKAKTEGYIWKIMGYILKKLWYIFLKLWDIFAKTMGFIWNNYGMYLAKTIGCIG